MNTLIHSSICPYKDIVLTHSMLKGLQFNIMSLCDPSCVLFKVQVGLQYRAELEFCVVLWHLISIRSFSNYTHFLCLQITNSNTTSQVKWAVSLVIADDHFIHSSVGLYGLTYFITHKVDSTEVNALFSSASLTCVCASVSSVLSSSTALSSPAMDVSRCFISLSASLRTSASRPLSFSSSWTSADRLPNASSFSVTAKTQTCTSE